MTKPTRQDPDIAALLAAAAKRKDSAAKIRLAGERAEGATYYREMQSADRLNADASRLFARAAERQQRRKRELAMIHLARKSLGLDEETYRAIVLRIAGGRTDSAGDCRAAERKALIDELKTKGFKPDRRRVSPESKHKSEKTQADKIRALWIALGNLGEVRRPTEKNLCKFCRRQTGKYSPDWLDGDEASKLIEALKSWLTRVEAKR